MPHDWYTKCRRVYCPVYGKVHIKYPLLLSEKLCGFHPTTYHKNQMFDIQQPMINKSMCSSGVVIQRKRFLLFFSFSSLDEKLLGEGRNICVRDDATLNSPLEIDNTACRRPTSPCSLVLARVVVFGSVLLADRKCADLDWKFAPS